MQDYSIGDLAAQSGVKVPTISHARDMGFSMESLKSMLRLAGHREAPCADVDALVAEHLAEVDARIAQLTRLRTELSGMLSDCHHGTVADCRIVEVLSDHEECAQEH